MSRFEQEAIRYFNKLGSGTFQRIDGIECFSPLSNYWFWRIRLWLMVRKGVLACMKTNSIWKSCNGMPAYGLPEPEVDDDL